MRFITNVKSIMASPLHPSGPFQRKHAYYCIVDIVNTSFSSGFLTITSTRNMSMSATYIEKQMIKWIHTESKWSVQIIGDYANEFSDKYVTVPTGYPVINKNNKYRKCAYYIIIVDTMESFVLKVKQIVSSKSFNSKALFVVYISYLGIEFRKQADIILKYLWNYQIFNSVAVTPQYSLITNNIYGFFPYITSQECGKNTQTLLMDKCDYGKRRNTHRLFPNKIPNDLDNCTVKAVAINSPPFVINVYNNSGFEINLLNIVAQKLNISFNFTVKRKSDYWSSRDNASQWQGAQKFMQDNLAIGVGNMIANGQIYEDFEVTTTYYFEYLRWIVPRADPAPRWKCLVVIFNGKLWLSCFAVYVTCSLLFYIMSNIRKEIKTYRGFWFSFISALSLLIGVALYRAPSTHILRIIFIMTALFGMIVASLYQSGLINVLTNPLYETQILTQEDILKSNLRIGGTPSYKELFIDRHSGEINERFVTNTSFANRNVYDWLVRVASVKDTCTVSNKFYVMYVKSRGDKKICNKKGQDQLYVTRKNLIAYPVHMLTVKGFPLFEQFNKAIFQICMGGLTVKWIEEIKYEINRKTKSPIKHDEDDDIMLTTEHLQGAFIVLIFGSICATVVFFLEWIIYKIKRTALYKRMFNKCLQCLKKCRKGKKETAGKIKNGKK